MRKPEGQDQLSVKILRGRHAGKTLVLSVEEFQPIEPSAYAWEAGWNCATTVDGKDEWYFVSEAGSVYSMTDVDSDEWNEDVGICELLQERAARIERELDKAYGYEGD